LLIWESKLLLAVKGKGGFGLALLNVPCFMVEALFHHMKHDGKRILPDDLQTYTAEDSRVGDLGL
jgi:hypothetical protein